MILFKHQSEKESHGYPGTYQPHLYNWTNVMRQLNNTTGKVKIPSVVVSETSDNYSIQIEIPGRNKEDFMVTREGDKLNVFALSPGAQFIGEPEYYLQEFPCDCFEYTVELPKNVDADFVRAEYKAGVLRFDFPIKENDCVRTVDSIVVY